MVRRPGGRSASIPDVASPFEASTEEAGRPGAVVDGPRTLPGAPLPNAALSNAVLPNRLLDILDEADRALLLPNLAPIDLGRGMTLFQPGDDVTHAYFPQAGSMVSLVIIMPDGKVAEAATVGREGAIGGLISLGHKPAFARAVVQIPGPALRVDTDVIEDAKHRSPRFRDVFARYADCLLAQVLQSVCCNVLHTLEARCCRWLLTTQDRVGANELPMTQEFLAEILGVQRTTVTAVAGALQEKGVISYHRGRIRVLDRPRLEALACDCHGCVRDHFERVLPGVYPPYAAAPASVTQGE